MYWWPFLVILLGVALLACSIGFKKFVYFLSVGYGFAIAACSIAIFVMVGVAQGGYGDMLWLLILQCAVFLLYGARLSGFLIYREAKSASYRKVLKEATSNEEAQKGEAKKEKKMPIFVAITIWLVVGVLYVAQTCPVLFRHMNESKDWIVPVIGVAISLLGLTLETIADLQKSAQKKENPHMVATKGLYKMVRCPNYFGEIVFWTGIFVSGITTYSQGATIGDCVGAWITAVLAYICIVYIMFNGAQRLEKRQNKNYGANPEYQAYVNRTPAILPLLPIYRLVKEKPSKKKEEEK